jgi:hypothetical protein
MTSKSSAYFFLNGSVYTDDGVLTLLSWAWVENFGGGWPRTIDIPQAA